MRLPLYARIDLSSGAVEDYPIREDYYRKFFGGKTLGTRLLMDLMKPRVDPLGPESVVILNTSPMTGTGAPSSSRFNMSFKNVLTGGVASSNCGGSFGIMLKKAGYDGLILMGQSEKPCTISVIDGVVTLSDATALWGLNTEEVQHTFDKQYGKLVIGPAGENLVRFAAAVSGERVAGRCGAGAVLGAKKIKAIVAYGTKKPEIYDPPRFDAFVKKWISFLRKHPMTGSSLPAHGSAGLVNKANAARALPSHNFKYGQSEFADAMSGETLADKHLVRNGNCLSCPIRCERRVMVDGKEVKGPEYETCGFFGPNIDAGDMGSLLKLNYVCDLLGMDTISLASTLAFAMELHENGVADFGVRFGDAASLVDICYKIAAREGLYDELANGSKWLSEKYGGKEYAIHSKGLELASYEPRRSVGMGLGYATSNRGGCHLNGGYPALLESVGVLSIAPLSPLAKPALTVFLQNGLEAVSCAGFCLFTAQSVIPSVLFKLGPHHPVTRTIGSVAQYLGPVIAGLLDIMPLLRFNTLYLFPHAEAARLATGVPLYTGSFVRLGERGYNLERLFNLREGLTAADDSLPARLTKVRQDESNPKTVVPLDRMLPVYYRVRHWDSGGVPTVKHLRRLGVY